MRTKPIGMPLRHPDRSIWGGKAANLLKLGQGQRIQIPDGVAISTDFYDAYTDHIKEQHGTDPETTISRTQKPTDERATAAQQLIEDTPLPTYLEEQLHTAIDQLEAPLIARSSATREDGDDSYAGRLESISAPDHETIGKAVREVYKSAVSERALDYLDKTGNENTGAVGILIQEHLDHEHGGVIYTKSPKDPEKVYIEVASSAEAVVDGEHVDSIEFEDRLGGDLKYIRDGEQIEDPEAYRLDRHQIEALNETAGQIEDLLNHEDPATPYDIEFAIQDDDIYILQARPLTGTQLEDEPFELSDVPDNQLLGETEIVRNYGITTGPAIVIDDADPTIPPDGPAYEMDEDLATLDDQYDGYILITPAVNPVIEQETDAVGGLVSYESGIASHAATVADEQDIPMMGATQLEDNFYDRPPTHGDILTLEINGQNGQLYRGTQQ